MLNISFKSAYNLLEQHYQRRSLNQVVFGNDTPDNIFEASKVAAIALDDYDYLSVTVNNRDSLDKKYALFIDGIDYENIPIVLEKDKDLTLLEVAVIAIKCPRIDIEKFKHIIEAQAESSQKDAKDCIETFLLLSEHLKKPPVKNDQS